MELRHLRYFIAVADAGSLTVAAEQKLRTSQPSLGRQIRDLEREVGVQLINRSAHGIELTSAGKAFLDHARMALFQAEAARSSATRSSADDTDICPWLYVGSRNRFVTRGELRPSEYREFPGIEIRLSSDYSPVLAKALMRRRLDAAFYTTGRAHGRVGLYARAYRTRWQFSCFRAVHRLASQVAVAPEEIVNETFYLPSKAALRGASRSFGVFQPCWSRSQARIRGAHIVHAISMITPKNDMNPTRCHSRSVSGFKIARAFGLLAPIDKIRQRSSGPWR